MTDPTRRSFLGYILGGAASTALLPGASMSPGKETSSPSPQSSLCSISSSTPDEIEKVQKTKGKDYLPQEEAPALILDRRRLTCVSIDLHCDLIDVTQIGDQYRSYIAGLGYAILTFHLSANPQTGLVLTSEEIDKLMPMPCSMERKPGFDPGSQHVSFHGPSLRGRR